jgi:hypothetical protein
MKVDFVNHSIGNNYGDLIELNEGLKTYPRLLKQVLNHELGHTKEGFKKNFLHDLTENKVSNKELLSFMLHYPKSLYQFRPFFWHKKYGFVYDVNLIIIYLVMILIIASAFVIAIK